jgi:hypothetical protein
MANPTGRGGFKTDKSGNPGSRPRQLASVMHERRGIRLRRRAPRVGYPLKSGAAAPG